MILMRDYYDPQTATDCTGEWVQGRWATWGEILIPIGTMKYEIWFYGLCVVLWVRENKTRGGTCGACNGHVIYEGIN